MPLSYHIGVGNKVFSPYQAEVQVLLYPGSSLIKVLIHLHDVQGIQGIHYVGSLQTAWNTQRETLTTTL